MLGSILSQLCSQVPGSALFYFGRGWGVLALGFGGGWPTTWSPSADLFCGLLSSGWCREAGISDRINAITGARICAVLFWLGGGGGLPLVRGAAESSHLVSMPTRVFLESADLEALLPGQNPCDHICAPTCCCCRAAVLVGSTVISGDPVRLVCCLGARSVV